MVDVVAVATAVAVTVLLLLLLELLLLSSQRRLIRLVPSQFVQMVVSGLQISWLLSALFQVASSNLLLSAASKR